MLRLEDTNDNSDWRCITTKYIKSLADGQLGTTKATLYTAPAATQAIVEKINLVNTSSGTVKVNLYFKASGGTSRRIIPYDMELEGYYSAVVDDEITLEAADIIEGDANAGSVVDYTLSGVENS